MAGTEKVNSPYKQQLIDTVREKVSRGMSFFQAMQEAVLEVPKPNVCPERQRLAQLKFDALNGRDLYTKLAAEIFNKSYESVTPLERSWIKARMFGHAYGRRRFGWSWGQGFVL